MALKLVVTTNVNGDVLELILRKSKYRVGRRHDNDLRIKETYISGYHSELNRNESGDYELSDAGSSNGTFLNGRRVDGSAVINAGDFIKFGILKVAVEEHEDSGPKIVSLKDRPAFAKKRNEMTAAISVSGNTGSIASAETISGPSEDTASNPAAVSPKELEKLEQQIKEEKDKVETLNAALDKEKTEREKLEAELDQVKKQADAAAEVEPLQSRLKETETEVSQLTKSLDELKVELEAKEELISQKAEVAGLKTQLKQQTDSLQAAKTEANQLRVDLQKSREEAAKNYSATEQELTSKIAELETAYAAEKVRANDSKSKSDALKAEIERLTSLSSETSSEADQLRKRVEEVSRQNGNLQAQLNKESAEASQLREQLADSGKNLSTLRAQIDSLEKEVTRKEQALEEKDQEYARTESDAIVQIKRDLGEAEAARDAANKKVEQLAKDKASLNSAFERLKGQLSDLEAAHKEAKEREEAFNHDKGLLARRLEKAESSNSELAARIKEDAAAAISNRKLIQKLESQLQANESEAIRIEREKSSSLTTEISKLERRNRDQGELVVQLQQQISEITRQRAVADENRLELQERIVALESEEISMKNLLQEAERTRASLSASLEEQTELANKRAATIEEQKQELSETVTRFRHAETSLLEKHRGELDALHGELREQRKYSADLENELENTRVGLSEALRSARDQAEQDRSKILADGYAKLSQIEDELSLAISSREEIELSRNALEDELNEREERIERLVEHVEDLELKIRDEQEAREQDLAVLEKTKAGFSNALSSNWKHLGIARSAADSERSARERSEAEIASAKAEIEKLESEAEKNRIRFEEEIADWEKRFDQLREEKLTLASEDANLKRIRDQILEAQSEKKLIETDLSKLSSGMKNFQRQHDELESQKDALLKEREELKAGLNAARLELESVQRRQAESQSQEEKLAEMIDSAERRIQSLKKLEAQMEQAVERKRQSGILSRSDVFSAKDIKETASHGDFSEEEFYRKLISKLDLIDDLSRRYDNRWRYPKVCDQLSILKNSFLDFLHDHSVREFRLDPGTVLSVEERKRIKLVPPDQANGKKGLPSAPGQNGNSSRVVETVRPGYIYKNGSVDIIIRKAEVIVG